MILGEGNKPLKKLVPGQFGEIVGWDGIPHGGEYFQVTTNTEAKKAQKFRIEEKEKQKDDEFKVKTQRDIGYEKQLIQAKLDSGYYKAGFPYLAWAVSELSSDIEHFLKTIKVRCN